MKADWSLREGRARPFGDPLLAAGLLFLCLSPLLLPWDHVLLLTIHRATGEAWDSLLLFIDHFLPPVLLSAGALGGGGLWLFGRRARQRSAGLALALVPILATGLVTGLLKHLVARVRPQGADLGGPPLHLLVRLSDTRSFPSGHATTAAAFGAVLLWLLPGRYLKGLALLLIPLMMWDRMALLLHYPSDVCAGAGVGLLCAWAYWRLLQSKDPAVPGWARGPLLLLLILSAGALWRKYLF